MLRAQQPWLWFPKEMVRGLLRMVLIMLPNIPGARTRSRYKRDNTSIKITSVPARHWSGRSLTDTNITLWCGGLCQRTRRNLFCGDTGCSKRQFDEIHAIFPSITYALLPIGPNRPDYLNSIHMDAEQAVQAYIDLEAQVCVPMHWGTFGFGVDEFMEPVDRMKKAWAEHNLPPEKLLVLKYGQRHSIAD